MSFRKKTAKKNSIIKSVGIIFSIIILCFLVSLSSIRVRREVIKAYNKFSVYMERMQIYNPVMTRHFGIHIPKGYKVHGIDVSRYQKKIDWAEVAKTRPDTLKIDFVFIKATEGKTLSDKYYGYNVKEARKNGILCGAYHYYKPNVNSTEQANNFISLVKLQPGDLPPVLDIEEESPYGNENMRRGIKNWLEIVEKHYGVKPIIYTSNSFHRDYLSGKEFEKYPFWIAHYYKKKIKTSCKWIFWQHSDKARVNGINGYVDMNVFNGNLEDLKKLCKKK